ncbi:NACHT, LRR and PYD domains-containing protein 12 isoform X2 [Carassius gibelio]|nr:NACHT, LRR and PYD domains-containing protein 12 isoform X2 [Carassius gibelio]XP_052450537.1 NACHT, LRR and PYD domains-containing protein 12 isoform X2 [Carassius gibelio]
MLDPIDLKRKPLLSVQRFGKQRKLNDVTNKSQASMTEPVAFHFEDFATEQQSHKNSIPELTVHSNSAMKCQQEFKSRLKAKFQCIYNDVPKQSHPTFLNDIFTELYITEGESENVNKEHEVRQIETALRRKTTVEIPVKCNDIFKHSSEENRPIKCVLTKGVAGIGKTVSVQKFILDWAEGSANQDIKFVYPLPFRELNLMKGKHFSLTELLQHFKMETGSGDNLENQLVLFIFDGLDECRFPLDFQNNGKLSNPTLPASIDVLLTNLISNNLLPDALIWITSRPAAASQIPLEYIDLVTEVRGFNDPQKEEYLTKRINDKHLSGRIITHLKSSRSLYIMCHIPVFCWLSVTVLERMFNTAEDEEIPKTLTQMYTHFLLLQTHAKNMRYTREHNPGPEDEERILKLGKLAFQQLKNGNLIFYEEDLMACGIDVKEAVVYSGVCSQIFREESALTENKVYCFIHLSIQEFLAAMYVYYMFKVHHRNVLGHEEHQELTETTLFDLHKTAIDEALKSENGHLDLFLRFLLGLSLESNQSLLQGLLSQSGSRDCQSIVETIEYIKKMIEEMSVPEKSINLFYCLNELNDLSLVKEVQRFLNSGHFSKLSPAQWSALVFVLLTSEEKLDVFDLKKYIRSDEGLTRLMPVVKASETALLDNCGLTLRCCRTLASTVGSSSSNVRVLDLCSNSIGDKGLELLTAGLENTQCNLEELRLSYCRITTRGCSVLKTGLLPNLPNLRVLDLSENSLREAGIKILADYVKDQHCKLEILRLKDCRVTTQGTIAIASGLLSNPSHLRELDLHWNNPGDDGVEKLSAVIQHPLSQLETLWLSYGLLTEKSCQSLASALRSSFSTLKALDLSGNAIYDEAVKMLSNGLGSPHCKVEILRLALCEITEVGVDDLASALVSNPAHLRELDLRQNHIKDFGVSRLAEMVKISNCRLEMLCLGDSGVTKDGCGVLAAALNSNPSYLRELDLSSNGLTDAGMRLLSPVLRNHSNNIMKLDLSQCGLTMACCDSLAAALQEKPSSLRELNLGVNNLQDLGIEILCAGLQNPHCQLHTLGLSNCGVTGEGCTILASALRSEHSLLRELDLSENNLTDSAVRPLSVLLDDPDCKLEKLILY